jgi:hypothetical protein
MQLNCPACGATFSLDAIIGHEGAREAVLVALQLPAPLGKTLIQYIGLFRPAQRALSMDRLAKLLNELLPMISKAQIERNGTIYAAPVDYWRNAMETMLASRDKLTLPLKSHGYLLEVIAAAAEKTAAKAEQQHEQGRKYGEVKAAQHNASAGKVIEKLVKPKAEKSVIPTHISEQIRNRD